MSMVSDKYDYCHIFKNLNNDNGLREVKAIKENYSPFLYAIKEVDKVVNKTIEIELTGIKMAAITGDKLP